ncbi:MAG: non-canonical purine NTP pyrophosphatase [Gemmatimonadetes bacterium]|nr:non-canonical purine NTP pyrophosphatase [Gemmatimonadota bacterium]
MKLLVATRSAHKIAEIRDILAGVPDLALVDLDEAGVPESPAEDDLEPHDTFEENAISKARYYHSVTGLPTVADDSGLEVDALGGAPGVLSKRFAPGDDLHGHERDLANNRYLLSKLRGLPPAARGARYVCVAALIEPGRPPRVFRGEAPGRIVDEPRGSGGFGYDPHVLDVQSRGTYAELSLEEKNARSHRGRAFGALAEVLRSRLS